MIIQWSRKASFICKDPRYHKHVNMKSNSNIALFDTPLQSIIKVYAFSYLKPKTMNFSQPKSLFYLYTQLKHLRISIWTRKRQHKKESLSRILKICLVWEKNYAKMQHLIYYASSFRVSWNKFFVEWVSREWNT